MSRLIPILILLLTIVGNDVYEDLPPGEYLDKPEQE
jgi:hypothetical protein